MNIVSADCPHCISRRDDRLSKLQGLNCTARTLPRECHENSRESQEPDFAFLPGQFLPRCLFGVNSLKDTEEFNHFIQWHQQQEVIYKENLLVYDFQLELKKYCQSDVELLKQGVTTF